jgi:hypothetical protein
VDSANATGIEKTSNGIMKNKRFIKKYFILII